MQGMIHSADISNVQAVLRCGARTSSKLNGGGEADPPTSGSDKTVGWVVGNAEGEGNVGEEANPPTSGSDKTAGWFSSFHFRMDGWMEPSLFPFSSSNNAITALLGYKSSTLAVVRVIGDVWFAWIQFSMAARSYVLPSGSITGLWIKLKVMGP